ncbi:glycosyltransferase [Paenibacillus sp. KS-LC4]|uniref:glycosyltransferase n=1 Tax=Paenibacillus sp. KS-LC4 TaxID=2979727 RepID=UPI0030CAC255
MRISTITPVYNNERYLEECIQSLLNQTYADMECIFVDDGSSDGSVHILRKYEDHPMVKVIYKASNGGISSAYREAIPHVTGEIICFLDADDVARPNRLQKTAEKFLDNSNTGIVYSRMLLINENSESFHLFLDLPDYVNNENLFMQLYRRGFFTGSGMSFRNYEWLKWDKNLICCDYYITLQIVGRGYGFEYESSVLTNYRIHGNNTSGQSGRLITNLMEVQGIFEYPFLLEQWTKQKHSLLEINTTFGINQYYFHQNYQNAEFYFEEAVNRGGNAESYFYLGNIYFKQGELEKAYKCCEKAYEIRPDSFHIVHNFGVMTALHLQRLTEARQLLEQAKHMESHYLLIDKNIKLMDTEDIASLKLIHFLSDKDAVYNSYCRIAVNQ